MTEATETAGLDRKFADDLNNDKELAKFTQRVLQGTDDLEPISVNFATETTPTDSVEFGADQVPTANRTSASTMTIAVYNHDLPLSPAPHAQDEFPSRETIAGPTSVAHQGALTDKPPPYLSNLPNAQGQYATTAVPTQLTGVEDATHWNTEMSTNNDEPMTSQFNEHEHLMKQRLGNTHQGWHPGVSVHHPPISTLTYNGAIRTNNSTTTTAPPKPMQRHGRDIAQSHPNNPKIVHFVGNCNNFYPLGNPLVDDIDWTLLENDYPRNGELRLVSENTTLPEYAVLVTNIVNHGEDNGIEFSFWRPVLNVRILDERDHGSQIGKKQYECKVDGENPQWFDEYRLRDMPGGEEALSRWNEWVGTAETRKKGAKPPPATIRGIEPATSLKGKSSEPAYWENALFQRTSDAETVLASRARTLRDNYFGNKDKKPKPAEPQALPASLSKHGRQLQKFLARRNTDESAAVSPHQDAANVDHTVSQPSMNMDGSENNESAVSNSDSRIYGDPAKKRCLPGQTVSWNFALPSSDTMEEELRKDARKRLNNAWSSHRREAIRSWDDLNNPDLFEGRTELEFVVDWAIAKSDKRGSDSYKEAESLDEKRKDCLDLLFSKPWKEWDDEWGINWQEDDGRIKIYEKELVKKIPKRDVEKLLKPALLMDLLNCIGHMRKDRRDRINKDQIGWPFFCELDPLSKEHDFEQHHNERKETAGSDGGSTFNKRLWRLLRIYELHEHQDFLLFSKPIKRPYTADEVRTTFSSQGISEVYVEKLCNHLGIPYQQLSAGGVLR